MTFARGRQVSDDARANARQVLGPEALATVVDVPEDWARFPRARNLFVRNWGHFDVREAYEACLHEGFPRAARLRARGYALRHFPRSISSDEGLLSILEDPESPMAQSVYNFSKLWADNITLLGEVQRRSRTDQQYAIQVAQNRRFVLREIWFLRQVEQRLAELLTLSLPEDPEEAFCWVAGVADIEISRFTLEVLKTPRRVVEVGLGLHLCCANFDEADVYIDRIRQRETVLVVLLLDGKPQALGEWCVQMYVEDGFDDDFRALLIEEGLFQGFRTNCSLDEWDQLMSDVDHVIEVIDNYNAGVPSWRQLRQEKNSDPSPELCQIFVDAEPELKRSLLRALAVKELRAAQPRLPRWALGPHMAIAIGSELAQNTTVRRLNLSGRSVCDVGANALAEGLRQNTTLTFLGLAHNDLSFEAALVLADALGRNASLRRLDLSGNGLPRMVAELDGRILVE